MSMNRILPEYDRGTPEYQDQVEGCAGCLDALIKALGGALGAGVLYLLARANQEEIQNLIEALQKLAN
jgi:hypothetical protein